MEQQFHLSEIFLVAPCWPHEWKKIHFQGEPAWSTWINEEKTLCYTEYRCPLTQLVGGIDMKAHDVFVIKRRATRENLDHLIEEGISICEEQSSEFVYILRSMQVRRRAWFANVLELTSFADQDTPVWENRQQGSFPLLRYSMNDLKERFITYLIYEKVRKSC